MSVLPVPGASYLCLFAPRSSFVATVGAEYKPYIGPVSTQTPTTVMSGKSPEEQEREIRDVLRKAERTPVRTSAQAS